MNNGRRTVILFGAGAPRDWGAPSTEEITNLICQPKSSFLCNDGKTKVTDFICDVLKKSGYEDTDINFETIINVLDEFITHHAYFDGKRRSPSISGSFFNSRSEHLLSNFSVVGGQKGHNFTLEIPKGQKFIYNKHAINNESPLQFYFQHLLAVLLTNINSIISKYSHHKEKKSAINQHKEINSSFQKWYASLSENSVVRMYTLNYDRLFKVLAAQTGVLVFEGFDCGEFVGDGNIPPDVPRILTDFESPVHYNLHGSAFWEVHTRDERGLRNVSISLASRAIFEINSNESSVIQIDKGKNLLISNIITGYHKTSKTFISPFRQIQSAFDRDCILADEIIIVGYSLGDYHINTSIANGLKHGSNLQVIDPTYASENNRVSDKLVNKLIAHFPDFFTSSNNLNWKWNGVSFCFNEGRQKITPLTFKEFLSRLKY